LDTSLVGFLNSGSSLPELTELEVLRAKYTGKLADTRAKGIDRVGPDAFARQLDQHLNTVQRKVRSGRYRFSPYLERLLPKGRAKLPRVVSCPTMRDKLVLLQLKEYLHSELSDAVNRRLPNQYIRDIRQFCESRQLAGLSFLRADISSFYDKIPHDQLFALLRARVPDDLALGLLRNAVRTPTVPPGTHRGRARRSLNRIGVPQGLPISNILANAYLLALDVVLGKASLLYLRYVDDILVIAETSRIQALREMLEAELSRLGLALNPDKTFSGLISTDFEYLGYAFCLPRISVRRVSYERFLGGVASLFAKYQHRLRNKEFPPYLSATLRRRAFVDEVNEKITGALNETRRYGWLFYFIEMNDEALLHALDGAIRHLFARLDDFVRKEPPELKKLSRSYFEARFSPDGGYILNYNSLTTVTSRLDFLIGRGILDATSARQLAAEEIHRHFEDYKQRQLQQLEMDVGLTS
jgi:RNA-directed DNA polymerase